MGNNTEDEVDLDIKEILYLLKEKIWLILLVTLIGGLGAGFVSTFLIRPVYTSSTMLFIMNQTASLTSLSDLQMGTQLTKDYRVLVTSRPVTEKVIENLGLELSSSELRDKVTISNPTDTRILTISVEDTNPVQARKIADEFAAVASERIAEIMDMTPPKLVEEAELPTSPTSPNIPYNSVLGAALGAVAVILVILLLHIWDDNIKSSDDVEKYLGLNTLALIPADESINSKKKAQKRKKKNTWKKKSA